MDVDEPHEDMCLDKAHQLHYLKLKQINIISMNYLNS